MSVNNENTNLRTSGKFYVFYLPAGVVERLYQQHTCHIGLLGAGAAVANF